MVVWFGFLWFVEGFLWFDEIGYGLGFCWFVLWFVEVLWFDEASLRGGPPACCNAMCCVGDIFWTMVDCMWGCVGGGNSEIMTHKSHFRLDYTSISCIYKVFKHIPMQWMAIWMYP